MKEFGSPLVSRIYLFSFQLPGYFCSILFFFRNGNIKFIRQKFQCIHKRQVFLLHDKAENITTGTTAKAMKKSFTFVYGKGWRLFTMKRTTPPISTALFLEWHIFGNNPHDVCFTSDLLFKIGVYFFRIFH